MCAVSANVRRGVGCLLHVPVAALTAPRRCLHLLARAASPVLYHGALSFPAAVARALRLSALNAP
eukprot:1738978-Pleurochrysis_carterae.AAC.1